MAGKMRPSVARERQRGEEEDGARRQSVSIFREVFPVIRELILTESPRLGRPVDRDDIGPWLERHPVVGVVLQRQYRKKSLSKASGKTYEQYCRNQVDFYGAKWTGFDNGSIKDGEYEMMRCARRGVRRLDRGNGQEPYRYVPESDS